MPSKDMDSAWSPALDSAQTQQAAQSSSDFLWVDCQDGKSQDAGVARTTQAFLQTKYHKLRRKTQLQQLKASMKALPSLRRPLPPASETDTSSQKEYKEDCIMTKAGSHQLPIKPNDRRIHRSLQLKVEDILPAVSPRVRQSVDFYFDYFRTQGSRRWYPLGQSEMLKCILRNSFDQPSLMEVIVSMSAFDYAMSFKAQEASNPVVHRSLQDAFYIRSHVIRSIQALLNKPNEIFSESAVLLIGHLFITEALEGNVNAVDAHTQGLVRIVHALGGLENVGEWPLANIYSCDPIRGLLKESPLVFDIPMDWEMRAFSAVADRARPIRPLYPVLGTCFFKSPWSQAIHPRLRTIIRVFQDIVCIYEETLRFNADLRLNDHNCALLLANRLHAVPYDFTISPFNETVRLAITLYILTRVWEFQPKVEKLVQSLHDRVEENVEFLEKSAPDLFFWMLFNGAFASAGFTCHVWFVARLKDLARELSLSKWEDVAGFLEGFFFVRRSRNESARVFWQKVVVEPDIDCVEVDTIITSP